MKPNRRSFLFLGVFALIQAPITAHAGVATDVPTDIQPIPTAKVEPLKVDVDLKKQPSLQVKPVALKAPKAKAVDTIVDADEFKKLGLGFTFHENNLQLTGELPEVCADQLTLDVKKESADALPSNTQLQNLDDLKEHASRVGGRLTFHGNENLKTLSDCVQHADDDKKDVSSISKLSHSAVSDHEIAMAGLLDSSNKVQLTDDSAKSGEYVKLEKQVQKLDCKECNADANSLRTRIDELKSTDSPLVASLLPKLLELSIQQSADRIPSAQSIHELEVIRGDLVQTANLIPTLKISVADQQKYLDSVTEQMTSLLGKDQELSVSTQSSVVLTQGADFMAQTYTAIAKLPKMDAERKKEALEIAKDYGKDGNRRLAFLSIDPSHPEVQAALKNGPAEIQKLQRNAQAVCAGTQNQFNFTNCSEAQKQLQIASSQLQSLQQRSYSISLNQNPYAQYPQYSPFGQMAGQMPSQMPGQMFGQMSGQMFSPFGQPYGQFFQGQAYSMFPQMYPMAFQGYGQNYGFGSMYINPTSSSMMFTPQITPNGMPLNSASFYQANSQTQTGNLQPTFVIN